LFVFVLNLVMQFVIIRKKNGQLCPILKDLSIYIQKDAAIFQNESLNYIKKCAVKNRGTQ